MKYTNIQNSKYYITIQISNQIHIYSYNSSKAIPNLNSLTFKSLNPKQNLNSETFLTSFVDCPDANPIILNIFLTTNPNPQLH